MLSGIFKCLIDRTWKLQHIYLTKKVLSTSKYRSVPFFESYNPSTSYFSLMRLVGPRLTFMRSFLDNLMAKKPVITMTVAY